ncbi:hypothetical protein [Streptomyces qinglanensis]|uniref:Uncharacterized protein n=1 Tax=Streptomyces qinglanensis TaxID=943816 RepID=A0A1H9WXP3_9ACTN|nr:hypothetical protein [Streptomyces qinglanensis]SES38676.1 hypothetical protein SAMN05421870_1257 [Streptomyces qinglanensis]
MSQNRADFGPVQLARWLGIEESQLRRAQNRGLIPPPDIDDKRWSYALAKTLPDRVDDIVAALEPQREEPAIPAPGSGPAVPRARGAHRAETMGPVQLSRYLGLKKWQLQRAQERGLVPEPDTEQKRWSKESVAALPDRVDEILAAVGDHPGLGSEKAAEHLAQRTGLEVERADIQLLAEQGTLRPVGDFRGWPLYAIADLDGLDPADVTAAISDRHAWVEASLSSEESAQLLGWPVGKFEVTAERHGLTPGRFGRYARGGVERLSEQ